MPQSPNEITKLVCFLRSNPMSHPSFPDHEVNYYDRFKRLDEYLNANIHLTVNQGAAANGDGWLTDHGIRHIKTVIRRADALVDIGDSLFLTPYEVYLLLVAIHFHDVGNVFGRDRHETKIAVLMQDLDETLIGADGMERRMIRDIAMAHGGYVDIEEIDKDTIGQLTWEHSDDRSEPRVQLLAALLRFADELADDHTRTSRFLVNSNLLRKSEAYHIYADRLRKVVIRPVNRRVSLLFEMNQTHAETKYWKGRRKVYLYDEIIERTLKMHREQVYCLRFMQPHVRIDMIDVSIVITTDDYMTVLKKITFSLFQRGYPDRPTSLGEVDVEASVAALTGKTLHRQISRISKNIEDA